MQDRMLRHLVQGKANVKFLAGTRCLSWRTTALDRSPPLVLVLHPRQSHLCASLILSSQVMLDTENKFVSTGMAKEIAAAAGGRYHYIPKASDKAIASVASQAMDGL